MNKPKKEDWEINTNPDHIYNKICELNNPNISMGYRDFVLQLHSNIKYNNDDCIGLTHFDTCEIWLDISLNDGTARETIIHEILHAITELVGLGGTSDDEANLNITNEELVNKMTKGLMLFCALNPELAKTIFFKEDKKIGRPKQK